MGRQGPGHSPRHARSLGPGGHYHWMVLAIRGVGDGAYWLELPIGGQLTAKKGAQGTSVAVMDSTPSAERRLELARALAAALLETASPRLPRGANDAPRC